MAKKWFLVLTAILLIYAPFCFLSSTLNVAPETGSTTVTLNSIADAYVNSSSPETNYGSLGRMNVSANSEQDFAYVKFDLASIPSDANTINATLKAYLSKTGGKIYWMPADKIGVYYCADNSWAEQEITWNNKPSFNPNPTSLWSFGVLEWVEYKSWDVTADVRTALPSRITTEVFKFATKTNDGFAVFQPREGENSPKLEVEYSSIPTNTPTPTSTPTPSLSPSPSLSPTESPTPTTNPTSAPTPTTAPTLTPTQTPAPLPTSTPTITPTITPTLNPTTPSPTPDNLLLYLPPAAFFGIAVAVVAIIIIGTLLLIELKKRQKH